MAVHILLLYTFGIACVIGGMVSVFYAYLILKKHYMGFSKFRKPAQYLFTGIFTLSMLIIQFITYYFYGIERIVEIFTPVTIMILVILLALGSRAFYLASTQIKLEGLGEQKKLLEKRTKILNKEYLKRKISEDAYKELKIDLEKEIINIESKISYLREQTKKLI